MLREGEAERSMDGKHPVFPWGCLIVLLMTVSLLLASHRFFWPTDWVEVTIGPLPKGDETFCLVIEDAEGIKPLSWYYSMVLPFEQSPFVGGNFSGVGWKSSHEEFVSVDVQWRDANRYGVLVYRPDGQWRLWWLNDRDLIQPTFMSRFYSDGKAEIHLPSESHAQTPSEQLLKTLGYLKKQ